MQKYWEAQQKKYAFMILPVANNYKDQLKKETVSSEKLFVQPCDVNLKKFDINPVSGKKIRDQLKIDKNAIVGIYVGKFGDIYWDKEAFQLFNKTSQYFGKQFHLLIVSPADTRSISENLKKVNFPHNQSTIIKASYYQIPDYLNAADFAFALYRPGHLKKYLSPIKVGEYWACGLPVIIPDGIGDDSQILKKTGLGVVIKDIEHLKKYFHQLDVLIKDNKKEEIRQMAVKYRNPDIVKKAYEKLIYGLMKKS